MRLGRSYIYVLMVAGLQIAIAILCRTTNTLFLTAVSATLVLLLSFRIKDINAKVTDSVKLLGNSSVENVSLPELIKVNMQKLKLVAEHIKQLGSVTEILPVHESLATDEVGQALHAVQEKMKNLKDEEEKRRYVTEGLAKFGELLRSKEPTKQYCESIIAALVKYVGANQGGLFLDADDEDNGRYMILMGSYAYERKRYLEKKIALGEGILGQCMYEKGIVFITDIPKEYLKITSGLGSAPPRNIVVIPLLANETFYGAIELAAFEILKPHQIEFLSKVSVMIASELGSIRTLEQTQLLLAASDELGHKLRANEEEMRVNMEELTATQEEMRRHQVELEKNQAELKSYMSAIENTIASAEFNIGGEIQKANKLFLTLTGYASEDVRGVSYLQLFNNAEGLHVMWDNLLLGKFFSGEFRMKDKDGKELWLNGTLNPIFDSRGRAEKIILFAQFTTREKEKINELNNMVSGLKQTLPLVEYTEDFRCKSANEKFLKMFEIGRLDLRNKTIKNFMHDNEFETTFMRRYPELLSNDQVQLSVNLYIKGQPKTWQVSLSVIRDLSGNITRFVMMLVHEVGEKALVSA